VDELDGKNIALQNVQFTLDSWTETSHESQSNLQLIKINH